MKEKFKQYDKVKYVGSCPHLATVQRYYAEKMVEIRFDSGVAVVDENDLILVENEV